MFELPRSEYLMNRKSIPILKVKQWMEQWGTRIGDPDFPKPPNEFYIASMLLSELRVLSGVHTRKLDQRKKADPNPGYQRAHQEDRSVSIARYMQYGYPLSTQNNLDVEEYRHLINPGWLPTAILVNIIDHKEVRSRAGKKITVEPDYEVQIENKDDHATLNYPVFDKQISPFGKDRLEPIEVIDGQHRLFACDNLDGNYDDYEVPVVFFNALDPKWQAYLFWVINVEPKKINPSLAFDLYPELRTQNWLEQGEKLRVYREHRAQELVEILWRHEKSPWKGRIELHGKRVRGHLSNAAYIRSLMASFIRRRHEKDVRIGGLFGSIESGNQERVLPWSRLQQAAFLIFLWRQIYNVVQASKADWAIECRKHVRQEDMFAKDLDLAFSSEYSLLATDQGVRAVLAVFNALLIASYEELELQDWDYKKPPSEFNDSQIDIALSELESNKKVTKFISMVSKALFDSSMDWRASSEPNLSRDQKLRQSVFKGSSGYTELQKQSFATLVESEDEKLSEIAKKTQYKLGWTV